VATALDNILLHSVGLHPVGPAEIARWPRLRKIKPRLRVVDDTIANIMSFYIRPARSN
jgi:hypothetical protein